jgi:hypothetical protein
MMSAPTSIFSGSDVGDHWRLKASPLLSMAGIGHGGFVRPDNRGRAAQSRRSIGRGIACSTSW